MSICRKPAKRGGRIPTRAGSAEGALESLKEEDLCEVRLIVATQPSMVKSIPGKIPEIMEVGLTGNDNIAKLEWASERLGGEIDVSDVWHAGQDVDVVGVTKGKGWQGAVKRWGVKILSHKNSKIVDQVIAEIEKKFGKMAVKRGKEHIFVGMNIVE